MPRDQDQRRKSSDSFDAIDPHFPPPSLRHHHEHREVEKRKKKEKKWSIGGLFRRKKKDTDTDSSSPLEEEEKKGFLEKRRAARRRRNRGSKDVTGSFDHIRMNQSNQQFEETAVEQRPYRESVNERLAGKSQESLIKRQEPRGSSVSLEDVGWKSGGRIQIKARVEACRGRLQADSSSDEGGGSSRHSISSLQKPKGDETSGSKDGSLSRRSRAARTERYKKRISRDEESLKDFPSGSSSRVSRSDEKLSSKNSSMEKVPPNNKWTAKVVYYESSDYETKYTAKTKSATPSPLQSPKARPKNALHHTSSAPPTSNYVTYPPSHAREGVAGSNQELRSHHFPQVISQVQKSRQRVEDPTPPRLPKSSSEMIAKPAHRSQAQKQSLWSQDVLNRKSASYDSNVNHLHCGKNQIDHSNNVDENILVVKFPLTKGLQKVDPSLNKRGVLHQQNQVRHQNPPPPPPPRDPHRKLLSTNGYNDGTRPMSYAFEDRNQQQYPVFPEFGSSVSAFQRVPKTNPIDFQPALPMNKHHRSSSDHHIPNKIKSTKMSPPMARRPSLVQQEVVNRLQPLNSEVFPSSPPSDITNSGGLPQHYQYYTDQQPRSRKPIHIAYQNQKPQNDSYLSDSQLAIKPPVQQSSKPRPSGVLNASEFWKQKDQESAKKIHLSEGSPKLIQRHLLNVNNVASNERSRSNSPYNDKSTATTKSKLTPLLMPSRNAESSGSLSSQSSPRDIPSPRTPNNRNPGYNEIGIPTFDGLDTNSLARKEYRPLSMLEEKTETSEQEVSPVRERLSNPPPPPMRKDSKVNAVTNFEYFDVFNVDSDIKDGRRKSSNLEEALNELEAIYKSLRLGEEVNMEKIAREKAIHDENRLDPSNWNAWVQSRGFESDSSFNYSTSLDSVDSVDSPIKRTKLKNQGLPDRMADDMAYRRLHKKDKPPPHEQEVISQAGSFLLVSPTLSPPPFVDVLPTALPPKDEPDVTLDDVVYRNIHHTNNSLKILDPQPPFGIPLGPIVPAPNSDYLHATPKDNYRPTFKPRKTPDVVADDLAYRNLRKDSNKEPLFSPEDTTFLDPPAIKKKRAVRSLSANLLSIIQKESMTLKNNNNLVYNNNSVQSDLEKSQSFTDVINAVTTNGLSSKPHAESRKLGELNIRKTFNGDDSDATPRLSRHYSIDNASPILTTSTETLTGSKASLGTHETKPLNQNISRISSPRPSVTPERRNTTDIVNPFIRKSDSPLRHVPVKIEPLKIDLNKNIKPTTSEIKKSPTPNRRAYTYHSEKQENVSPLTYDRAESDLLAILAREAKEASEQLSKELNELNFDSRIKPIKPLSSKSCNESSQNLENKGKDVSKELLFNQSFIKPIGKITPHKPVKLNTFCITEDDKLESKETVVTEKPLEIEGSKSMTDLLKELTRSLDFDFGSRRGSGETTQTSETQGVEELELDESPDATIETEIFFETNEPRNVRKDSDEKYFSSLEEFPDQHNLSPKHAFLKTLSMSRDKSDVTVPPYAQFRSISLQNIENKETPFKPMENSNSSSKPKIINESVQSLSSSPFSNLMLSEVSQNTSCDTSKYLAQEKTEPLSPLESSLLDITDNILDKELLTVVDDQSLTTSPVKKFPLDIPDDSDVHELEQKTKDTVEQYKSEIPTVQTSRTVDCDVSPENSDSNSKIRGSSKDFDSRVKGSSRDSGTSACSTDSRIPGCSMDCSSDSKRCSSLADEGTKSLQSVLEPSTLLLVCMACAHQLAGLDFLTILGLILAMASIILFLIL